MLDDDVKVFSGLNLNVLYTTINFNNSIRQQFGENIFQKYSIKTLNISKGHLAACADFILSAERRATYDYINSAPQWLEGNKKSWSNLERDLRIKISNESSDITVYTGTFGNLTFKTDHGEDKTVYLSKRNELVIVPVPLYFYKRSTNNIAALTSLNCLYTTAPPVRCARCLVHKAAGTCHVGKAASRVAPPLLRPLSPVASLRRRPPAAPASTIERHTPSVPIDAARVPCATLHDCHEATAAFFNK
ncbi:uncharacterized protein ACR2FA_010549 [Aphomia sociella]